MDYNGPGGRIWLTWLPTEVGVEILQVDRQFIHCKLTNKKEHTNCLITVIYGDYDLIPRRDLWRNIVQLSGGICDEPWLLTGDFNAVMDGSEVNGYAADTSNSMAEFQECVATSGLIQLSYTGAPFTWHNCSEGGRSLWKRLDRMLVNEAWLTIWPLTKYLCSTPRTSDHAPLILQGHEMQREVTMFRFEIFLTKLPSFLSSVKDVWRHHIVGTSMYALTRKLKALKPVLRGIRKHQGDLSQNVTSAANFLSVAQRLNQEFQHDSVLMSLEKCCRIVYCKAVNLEVNMLQQRAKLSWLKGGDQCSKIFHRKINAKRAAQRVYQIQNSEGILLTNYSDVVKEFRQEIKDALFDIAEDSAPGPDGFSSGFFKASWTKYCPNVLLAQELLAGYKQKKMPPRCTIKVDLQKAYDMVDWDYLLAVLRMFKFPGKFILWVEQCITTASFSISLNGGLHGFFQSSRGLRQGDPISPYLFVLVMESFHLLLLHKIRNDDNFKFHWRCKELGIVNLSFADDILLFCKADLHSVSVLKEGLLEFKELSGLQANAQKSQIIISKAGAQQLPQILTMLGFSQGHLPIKYLGVPLISSKLSIADCTPLLQKIESRITGWNQLNLSYAGRTQLIKSVLSSIHLYWSSVFILPKGVVKMIEMQLKGFLWRGSTGSGGYKVSWDLVCQPISHGGLGIRNVQSMNQALMAKHLWQVVTNQRDSIWVTWVLLYRLKHHTVWSYHGTGGSWCWKKLMKLRCQLIKGLKFRVGNGNSFKLWLDPWLVDGPLINKYPRGPLITGLSVDSWLNVVIDRDNWNWPSQAHTDIAEIISNLPPIHNGSNDQVVWKNSSGMFSMGITSSGPFYYTKT
ncbi:UNVERIFIED_CONTAM: putative ribonuclease H protein [Sesamum radiatum]|uniref:Ribonuclease H protein n=1 Tax=Sesamum radiatum TaxID=300843 RepID=A0AAW2J5P2_SESRA